MTHATGQFATTASSEYFNAFLNRTILLLGEQAVQALRTRTVGIAGCGGVGAASAVTLARMGVGGFVLADPGVFDEPDINRQWGATVNVLGRNKAEVYEEILRSINPSVRVRTLPERGIADDTVEAFVNDVDLLIDCLDIAVANDLRMTMFRMARSKGIYAISAPVLGFGTVVVVGSPDGMPMEAVFGAYVESAAENARIPKGLWSIFVPEHLAVSERHMVHHKVPSIAISPVLASSLVCTESALVLLGATFEGWRPPICLPQVLVVEPLTQQYRIMDIRELAERPSTSSVAADPSAASCRVDRSTEDRHRLLSQVGFNAALLPHDGVAVDLLTDSWSEIPWSAEADTPARTAAQPHARPETLLQGMFGYRYVTPVFRGRFAEALLAKAAIRPGWTVATNALFPSTRFHLEASGARLIELGVSETGEAGGDGLFPGNLNCALLGDAIEAGEVDAVYVELCVNASGGHPVSVRNLRDIRLLTAPRGIPIFLDATRAFENAVHVRERESDFAEKGLVETVRELCALSDGCAASLTKDFKSPLGAFIGVNDENLFVKVRDLAVLAYGTGLSDEGLKTLARALRTPDETRGAPARVALARRLWERLRGIGVPMVEPAGGHGVFIDVAAFLPHVRAQDYPGHALAGALFIEGGVRAAPNMISPEQTRRGVRMLRLAIPVESYGERDIDTITNAFVRVMARRHSIGGLKRVGGPPGMLGEFAAQFRPLYDSTVEGAKRSIR
jgi:tyrosine phenol-lyase